MKGEAKKLIRERWSLSFIAYLSFSNFWSTLHFSNTVFGSSIPLTIADQFAVASPLMIIPSLTSALCFIVLFLFYRKRNTEFGMKEQRQFALYTAFGSGLLSLLSFIPGMPLFCLALGAICSGFFYASSILIFVTRSQLMRLSKAFSYLALGAVGGCVFGLAAHAFASVFSVLNSYILVPSIMVILIYIYDSKHNTKEPERSLESEKGFNKSLVHLFSVLCVAGIVIGLNFAQSFDSTTIVQSNIATSNAIGSMFGAILLLAIVVYSSCTLEVILLRISFPIMAVGVFAYALQICFPSLVLMPTPSLITLIGSQSVVTLSWVICVYFATYKKISVMHICTLLFSGLFIGRTIGILIEAIVASLSATTSSELIIRFIQLALLYFASTALIMPSDSQTHVARAWQHVRITPGSGEGESTSQALAIIRDVHEFTPREFEVFIMLANGRNKKYIAKKLTISENTAKTHVGKIYQKMGVHSQQELLDTIDEAERRIRE